MNNECDGSILFKIYYLKSTFSFTYVSMNRISLMFNQLNIYSALSIDLIQRNAFLKND